MPGSKPELKIEMLDNNILLIKQEIKKSEFEVTGDVDRNMPLYRVAVCGPNAPVKVGDIVIMKPMSYENIMIDGQTYLFAEGTQIAGRKIR